MISTAQVTKAAGFSSITAGLRSAGSSVRSVFNRVGSSISGALSSATSCFGSRNRNTTTFDTVESTTGSDGTVYGTLRIRSGGNNIPTVNNGGSAGDDTIYATVVRSPQGSGASSSTGGNTVTVNAQVHSNATGDNNSSSPNKKTPPPVAPKPKVPTPPVRSTSLSPDSYKHLTLPTNLEV